MSNNARAANMLDLHIDASEWRSALRQYLGLTDKTLPEVLNTKMFFILKRARELTPKATAEVIESALGVSGVETRVSRKTGKVRVKRYILVTQAPRAALIVQARRRDKGLPGLYGAKMAKAVRSLINRRKAAIGSLRAGWRKALRAFGLAAKQIAPAGDPRVRHPGEARIARQSYVPEAIAYYDLQARGRIDPRVESALASAMRDELASTREYVRKKMQEIADRYNAVG